MTKLIFAFLLMITVWGCSSKPDSTIQVEKCTTSSTSSELWGTIIQFNGCSIPNSEQSKMAELKYCKQGEVITVMDGGMDNEYVCQSIPNFQNTELAIGTYCFYLSIAPVLSDVLSQNEKKTGSNKFFSELVKNDMRYPTKATFEFRYKEQFVNWLYGSFQNQNENNNINKKDVLHWYKVNCLPLH